MRKKHFLVRIGSIAIAGGLLLTVYLLFGESILRFWMRSQAEKGNWTSLDWYLSRNPDLNRPDGFGFSLLTEAAHQNDFYVVAFLLDCGANPNASSIYVKPPLFSAAEWGNRFMFRELIDHGADVNIGTTEGGSSVLYTFGVSDVGILKDAKDYGAILTPMFTDEYSSHPIHYAATNRFDDPACVAFFESNGIPIDLKDKHGSTPLDIAINAGNKKVADYIRKQESLAAIPAESSIQNEQ